MAELADVESTQPKRLDYRAAGVDIAAGDAVVGAIGAAVRRTHTERVLRGLGHFGGFFRIGPADGNATLVASTDSVGTKLKVAILAGRHDGIGVDLVHHCINDIIACGAEPLFFLDYYATGALDPGHAAEIVTGIAGACETHGVALIGGETAELPGIYAAGDYDIAGFIIGIVDAERIIDGSTIRAGDVVLGLPSAGFHTNGYSLVRAVLGLNDEQAESAADLLAGTIPGESERSLAELLLEPHRCYLPEVRRLLGADVVQGMAHITGGGIGGNVSRVVPPGVTVEIDPATWKTPAVMDYVITQGGIVRAEAFNAFNMGIGFVLVVREDDLQQARRLVPDALVIGRVVAATGGERVRVGGVS